MTTTADMSSALKKHCVPTLREMGFKGSFANIYRDVDGFVSLANFQFSAHGEKFCINLGFADPARRNVVGHCKYFEPKKLRVSMIGGLYENENFLSGRWRVGQQPIDGGLFSDSWFFFAPGQHGGDREERAIDPCKLARHCAALLTQEAREWWTGRRDFAAPIHREPGS